MTTFTLIHVAISLLGIGAGLVVVFGFLTANRLDVWTAVFLASTVATSVTGYALPADRILPSHIVGGISLVVLAVSIYARYTRRLSRSWRTVYVVTAVLALYLNCFVLVAQSFLRVPALHAMAPTGTETPFQIAQLALLALFVVLGVASVIRFRYESVTLSGRLTLRGQPQSL